MQCVCVWMINENGYQYKWSRLWRRSYRPGTEPTISSWCAWVSEKMEFELKPASDIQKLWQIHRALNSHLGLKASKLPVQKTNNLKLQFFFFVNNKLQWVVYIMVSNLHALSSQKSAGYNSTIADHELNWSHIIPTPFWTCRAHWV